MHTSESTPQPRLRLTEARNQRGLSQQGLADTIGTNYVNVSRWERGITKPSPYFRRKLCTFFGLTEGELDLVPPASNGRGKKAAGATSALSPVATTGTVETAEAVASPPASAALYDPAIPLLPAIELVGREADLARIKQRLRSGGSVALTALNGLPGVGKTALSITLAHDPEIRAHFRDGVLWAGLGPNPNLPGLLSRWGSLLGISTTQMATLSSNEAWARAIRTAIGTRAMLLVIDDAWELDDALMFRVGGQNCAHLVTTRFPNIASHMTVDGATLIQSLSEEQSIKLLGLLAPQVVSREAQKAHDLVQAVGGLPLALTLMGNYLRKQAYSGPARRITAALQRLSDAEERLQLNEPHVPVESHPSLPVETSLSLQSIIAVTDQLLSPEARAALYALAVFPAKPNTFSEEAALAVANCSTDELDALSDAGLLESSGSERDRYTLHQVIADYARLRLQGQEARERLVVYIVGYVDAHKRDYEQLELESGTILTALEMAHELSMRAELVRIACTFAPFLILKGFYAQAEDHLKRAYTAAMAIDDSYGITGALLYLGEVAQKQGNYAQAETYFQEGLELARQVADHERISALLTGLGAVTWRRGKAAQAEEYLQEGLALARQIDDHERISALLQILGSVVVRRGDFAQAEAYLQEGLEHARQIGMREQICVLLMNLGATVGQQGHDAQAEAYFQEGLILARQIGHREWISALLSNLGDIADAQGNHTKAEGYFLEGLKLAKAIENREWMTMLLLNLGVTTRKQKNYLQAALYLKESLVLAKQIGISQITANVLYEYGNLCLDQQQVEEAEATFCEMLEIVSNHGQDLIALAKFGLARTAAMKGNLEDARKLGEESAATLGNMGHRNAEEVKNWLESIQS